MTRATLLAIAVLGALVGLVTAAQEQVDHPAVIPGYERLLASGEVDAASLGEILLGELNCLSCHLPGSGAAVRVDTKPAPDLRRIGERATPEWIREFIVDPHSAKLGTTMPALLAGHDAAARERLADEIAHFLVAQSSAPAPPPFPAFRFRAAVERGREMFHTVGCVSCHAPALSEPMTTTSVSLPVLARKTNVVALADFLLDPEATRYSSRMPALHLSRAEATDLAVYLLRDQEPARIEYRPGFEFEYFVHPPISESEARDTGGPPPDLSGLQPDGTGQVDRLSLTLPVPTQRANHSYRFSGLLRVGEAGRYTFDVRAGRQATARLSIDGELVATKAVGSVREASVSLHLDPGLHPVAVEYHLRQAAGPANLGVSVDGPASGPVDLGRSVVFEAIELAPPGLDSLQVDDAKAARGRREFAAVGCASCHALASAPTDVVPDLHAPSLAEIATASMAEGSWQHLAEGAPRYQLDANQRRAIGAALAEPANLARPRDDSAEITHTLATFNCYACHSRAGEEGLIGGPDADRRMFFRVVGNQDLGDEGRYPPSLTGVGGKLRRPALASILREDRLHIRRDYMHTRMPRFSGEQLAALPDLLARVDSRDGDLSEPPLSVAAVEAGRRLVGSEGLRCIACHDVGGGRTYGISVANLGLAYERLRPGWLEAFMRDPGAVNTGTRMPQYWVGDSVVFDDVAGGTAQGQIDAIWSYLSLGSSMPMPAGMDVGDTLVLTPAEEALVFRTFMTGASPRAITVGFPEGVHAAFDANVIRLAKVWRGGFFDAKGTWSGRAGQFFGPLGDDVLDMPPGPAVAVLASPDAAWPQPLLTDRDLGGEFRGYRYDAERRPEFEYTLGETRITEKLLPVVSAGGANLVRRFSIDSAGATEPLYLLAAEGLEIVPTDTGAWSIDGQQTVTLAASASVEPILRSSQGAMQLLVPIPSGLGEPLRIELEIQW